MNRFQDRVALVTGAASGIGRATALRLVAEGARTVCVDIEREALEEVVREIESQGGTAIAQVCDVSDSEAVHNAVAGAIRQYGKLDVLCNVAGVLESSHTHEYPRDRWERLIAVNLTGTFLLCQEAIPHLIEARGNIVNVASLAALRGHPYLAAYAASKGGIVGLTRALAIEYIHVGFRANAVCPAAIDTPMTSEFEVPEGASLELLMRNIPPDGAVRGPETVAGVIAFLASADAAHINGVALRVDGGIMS
jgi:NAD(P)-dependent dehydrogenase (short-subunit alcohol dehydrogenase family)